MILPAFAAERRRLLHGACCTIDISCPHGAQQQTRAVAAVESINRADRQTDGRTDNRYIETCSAFSAGGVKYTKEYGAEYE